MSLIERIECPEHGDTLGSAAHGMPERWCSECHGWVDSVKVEYVRASIYRGAVQERDAFARALTLAVASPELREAYVRRAKDALATPKEGQ